MGLVLERIWNFYYNIFYTLSNWWKVRSRNVVSTALAYEKKLQKKGKTKTKENVKRMV